MILKTLLILNVDLYSKTISRLDIQSHKIVFIDVVIILICLFVVAPARCPGMHIVLASQATALSMDYNYKTVLEMYHSVECTKFGQ